MTTPTKTLMTLAAIATLGPATLATAASAPTLSDLTTFQAGQTTPVDIAGNHLHQGDTIRKGTKLLRWKVTLHGASKTPVTLTAPKGYRITGLGLNHTSKVGFVVQGKRPYGKRSISIRAYRAPGGTDTSSGHMYALVRR